MISWLGILYSISHKDVDDSLINAGLAYGSAKPLNSIVSTIQSTEVGLMVADVTLGEAIDPINHLVERYSSLMELSLGSLLIQKLLLEIVYTKLVKFIITILGISLAYSILV